MKRSQAKKKPVIATVDLFCGAGGLTCGLRKEGFDVRAGFDVDPLCKYPYERNNKAKFLLRDVAKISGDDLKPLLSNADYSMLAGCAPCQPFSKYTQGKNPETDGKWGLLKHFSRLVNDTLPDFITMENVPQLSNHSVLNEFVGVLKEAEYQIACSVVNCAEYGIPQSRERLVLLASRFTSAPLELVSSARYRTRNVRQAISHLPPLGPGGVDPVDYLHRSSGLSNLNQQRIRASKPGGSWKDWPESLRAACHTRDSGRGYVSVYGRMTWDDPAPTMTTQCFGFGNGRFGHPEQDRAISLREAAIIQTFPGSYKFEPDGIDVGMSTLGRLIGNAVPVKLGIIVARSFKKHIELLNSHAHV